MSKPDFKSVFSNPSDHIDFLCQKTDSDFEGQHFDRKQAGRPDGNGALSKSQLGSIRELVESTMSGFANADGGVLILGIEKSGIVFGVDHLNEGQLNGLLNLRSMSGATIQSKTQPIVTPSGETRNVALFMVEADDRTYCYRVNDDAAWIRKGQSTLRLRGMELEQVKRDRKFVDFELSRTEHFEEQDVDDAVLKEFVLSQSGEGDDRDVVRVLRDAGAISGKPDDREWTNAGLLFFAENPRRVLAQSYIRLLRFECSYDDQDERPTPSFEKDFDGPLTKQIRQFRVFIQESGFFKSYDLRAPSGEIVSEPEYPPIAIDEAVVNAVAHRDYGISQPITCEKYNDAFVVKSPGRLKQPFEVPDAFRLKEQSLESLPRNRKLVDWLRLMKDAKGRQYVKAIREGTRKMRDEMQSLGLPSPAYLLKETETAVILRNDAARREAKPTGLADEGEVDSDEYTNLYQLTGLDAISAVEGEREQRRILLETLCDKLQANGWVLDRLTKGRAIVHLKGERSQLPPALSKTLRIIPAYSISVRSYHGRHYLIVDYTVQVQSLLTAQQVQQKFDKSVFVGSKAFATIDGKLVRGQIIDTSSGNVQLRVFDSDDEETISATKVFPSLPRKVLNEIVAAAAPSFDLPKAIKNASLSSSRSAARQRAALIENTIQTLCGTIFPLSMGGAQIALSEWPLRLRADGDGKRAWRVDEIEEPEVEFSRHRATPNIRDGITSFGAYDDDPKDLDIVAVVQPGFETPMRDLVTRLQAGAYKYRGSERTFSTRFRLAQVSTAQDITADDECRRLISEYPEWAGNEKRDRVFLVHTPESEFALDDVSSPYYQAKRALLEAGIPCQMVDTPTLKNPDWKDLNLALNIVAKTGVTPWVLPESIPDADFFIGLSYTSSRNPEDDRLLGFANVFNQYGRWEFYSGGTGAVPYRERESHYEELVAETMSKLTLQERPTICFHYSAKYSRADRDAILRGARKIRPRGKYVFIWINSHHPVRFFDERTETDGSLARGRYTIGSPNQIYLSTTGYNPYRKMLGTPQALEVNAYRDTDLDVTPKPVDHRALARQILSLTKLNWASTDALCAEPITTKYAKDIAYLTAAFQRQQRGQFLLHPVLERTPWFI